jgi:ADP-heptose:LPS heptosyltransferase
MKNIILSRTDNLGDVMLTLPMAGAIKKQLPDSQVFFIGKNYTRPLIESCTFVDYFLDREEILAQPNLLKNINADAIIHVFPDRAIAKLAKSVQIPRRIGTSHRLFHWFTCNYLPNLSRKNSNLHEAQLNLRLLKPLGLKFDYQTDEISNLYGMSKIGELDNYLKELINTSKFNLVLHPKSKGSAREWELGNYYQLVHLLDGNQFEIFITGTQAEGEQIRKLLPQIFDADRVHDLTGKLTLHQLIQFINQVDGFVSCSTGPLHIASALGKKAIGIFPPIRPMHPQRWAAIGRDAHTLCVEKKCEECRKSGKCVCIQEITPIQVKTLLENKD